MEDKESVSIEKLITAGIQAGKSKYILDYLSTDDNIDYKAKLEQDMYKLADKFTELGEEGTLPEELKEYYTLAKLFGKFDNLKSGDKKPNYRIEESTKTDNVGEIVPVYDLHLMVAGNEMKIPITKEEFDEYAEPLLEYKKGLLKKGDGKKKKKNPFK